MIERITSQFDWVFQMPIESQCHFAIGLSLAGFLFAAIVRETCKEPSVRYVARAVGAASFFAVAAFAHHVAHENEKHNSELMLRRGVDAKEVADQTRYVAIASEYTTTVGNQSFSVVRFAGGRERPVSITARREGGIGSAGRGDIRGVRGGVDSGRGTSDCIDDVRDGKQHAVKF